MGCDKHPFSTPKSVKSDTTIATTSLSDVLPELRTQKDSLLSYLPSEAKFLSYKEDSTIFSVRVPQGKPFDVIVVNFIAQLLDHGFQVNDAYHNSKRGRATLQVITPQQDSLKIRVIQGLNYFATSGTLLLVIRNINNVDAATRLKFLTSHYSFNYLLPSWVENRDTTIAILARYGGDIILQMPLESSLRRLTKKTDHTIYVDDKVKTMRKRVGALVELNPSVVGMSVFGGDLVLNSETASASFMKTLKFFDLTYYSLPKMPNSLALQAAQAEKTTAIPIRYQISTTKVDDIAEELHHFGLVATKRKNVYLIADASLELLEALSQSNDYFKTIGISLATISSLQD